MATLSSRLDKLEDRLASPDTKEYNLVADLEGKSEEFVFLFLLSTYQAHMAFYGEESYTLSEEFRLEVEANLRETASRLGYVEVSRTYTTGERLKWEKVDGLTTWTKKLPSISYKVIDFVKADTL